MNEQLEERYAQDLQRIRYFMIAGSAACLAFALSRDDPTSVNTVADFLWLGAVISWGTSFVSGFFGIENANQATFKNIGMLRTEDLGMDKVSLALEQQYKRHTERAVRFYSLQKWALLAGACVFGLSVIVTRFGLFA